jgi:hypothetical protein
MEFNARAVVGIFNTDLHKYVFVVFLRFGNAFCIVGGVGFDGCKADGGSQMKTLI